MADLKYPAPWEAVFEKESGRFMIVQELCCFAYVEWGYAYGYDEPDSEDWAVARLMAAAPELREALEALIDFIRLIGSDEDPMQAELLAKARAAIAKAKGEEHE